MEPSPQPRQLTEKERTGCLLTFIKLAAAVAVIAYGIYLLIRH
jgi:hypothetical protein